MELGNRDGDLEEKMEFPNLYLKPLSHEQIAFNCRRTPTEFEHIQRSYFFLFCFNFVVLELEAKVKAITQASEGLKGIAAETFCVWKGD